MGMGEGTGSTSKHGRNSSISIDHSLTGNHKQRFVRGHSSSGIANESGVGVDREKNPDIIPDGGKYSTYKYGNIHIHQCRKNSLPQNFEISNDILRIYFNSHSISTDCYEGSDVENTKL